MAGIGRLDVALGLDAAEYTAGLAKAEQQAQKFAQQIDKQIAALRTQAQVVGFTAEQLKIYELRQKGASDAQLLSAVNLLKQNKAFADAQKAIASAADTAKIAANASAGIDKQVKALHDQVAVQGRSERATKLYELTQAGATKEQLKSADAALRQKAAYEGTVRFMGDLKVAALAAGAALLTAGIGAAILFEKLVGKAASFQDLAEKTGASAEALASFQVAASVTNTSMDTLANLSVKLTKGLAGTDEETKQAANAIRQLGLNVQDFKKLDPATQFEVIGKRLNQFADGSGKTAFAVAALGRAGADALPFLKELGAQGQRNVVLTAAEIKAADDYKDAQSRLRAEVELYATKLAVQVLPVVQDFKKALLETAKQILGVSTEASKLAGSNDVQDFADNSARSIAVLVDGLDIVARGFQLVGANIAGVLGQLDQLQRFDFKGLARVQREQDETVNKIIDRPLFSSNLEAARRKRASDANAFESNFVPSDKPILDASRFGGGGGASAAASKAAQEAKKNLELQLSTLDNFIKNEDRLLDSRNKSLERLYGQDRISIKAYFDAKDAALDDATFQTAAAYEKQIALLQKFYKDSKSETTKLDALKEIGDKRQKQSDALSKASDEATKTSDARARAILEYGEKVDEVRAKVLDLLNTEAAAAEAASIRFKASNKGLISQATAQGDDETKRNIALLEARSDAQARLNSQLDKARLIQDELGTTEGRLALDRDRGLRSELDTYAALGAARRSSAAQLQLIADKYAEMGEKFKDPELVAAAKRLQLGIDQISASADVLGNKLRTEFAESFQGSFEGFLNDLAEGKNVLDSFKNAFLSFANDIIKNVNRIAAQSVTDALFQGNGASGGGGYGTALASFFASAFGGQDMTGIHAGGTPFVQRDGMAYLHRGERVVTASENRGGRGMNIQNTFVLPPGGLTQATQSQIGAYSAKSLAIANRRFN